MPYLTTGRMIDQTEINDIVYGISEYYKPIYIKRVEQGFYKLNDDMEIHEPLLMQSLLGYNWQWEIQPKTVTFERAKAALQSGKIIQCEMPISNRVTRYFNNQGVISYGGDALTWDQIFNGMWTIDN